MMAEKVTSLEVARLAGVSQSAVSRVFTPGASASKKTAEKVRRAAEELGYRPNQLARAMITGKTRLIGLVVAYLDNQFYPIALERLSRALQLQGYHVLIFMAENSTDGVAEMIDELLSYQVAAIVTASVAMSNDLTTRCENAGIPVVMFNRGQDDPRLSAVTSDNIAGGRSVAHFLAAGGHTRIAHIAGWQGASTGIDRARGFVDGLTERGLKPVAVLDGMFDRDTAAGHARALFSGADRPEAVFVGNDHMALAVMDTLRFELGLRIPDDVSVVGYDDVPNAAWPTYDLTTIRQPVNRMVEATVDALIGRIDGDNEPRRIQIPGALIQRGSARKPKGFTT
ncbi:LacI family DNA-binding transcriptional regulator [Sulfitobacter sp. D35]|uniref:LacI family DNA-binding transcriptional regulator n=1 Tax=Sulfitobacter sp. D35 TaxID=3083252 RepID=UPI00296EFA49|nr:LacI family DNA-binding transcriptional regulator [Sulfitobacter sp. D35]MDW4499323.1 LacI family DNA-binding transcriptional regulator [Sulfitobacter sp. D35]